MVLDLKNLPALTFADADAENLLANAKKILEAELGRNVERSDPLWLFVESLIAVILQERILLDTIAKDNLLAYSRKESLEHLGALVGVYRLPAAHATCTCKVNLSDALDRSVSIAKGTRISAGNEIYFALDDDLIFLRGETELSASFTCLESGELGNNFSVGELNKIVDPQPYLLSIENITVSDGGADVESDDSLRERIRIAPESFSTAGPSGAYEFFIKEASSLITDVAITSDNPGEVDIYFLQSNSDTPTAEVIALVEEKLSDRTIRPLTDKVVVKNPAVVEFAIELKYFISRDDSAAALKIQRQVDAAIDEYIFWQKSKLGRDVNDSKLVQMIKDAGAKRVEIVQPNFLAIEKNSVAVCVDKNVFFAGLEDD